MQIKTLYIPKKIPYTGKELRSLFIYHTFNLQGNALVAFQGACHVELRDLVDQEDVKANAPIKSQLMLHFLGEFFGDDLEKTILRQRLLMTVMLDWLRETSPNIPWIRQGDDLFVKERKASVSIATASQVSTLLHAGVNIVSRGTPIPTFGLNDADIQPEKFAKKVLSRFKNEHDEMALARCKVRGVP